MTKSILRRLGYLSIVVAPLLSLMLLGVIPIQEWFEVRDTKNDLLVELVEIVLQEKDLILKKITNM